MLDYMVHEPMLVLSWNYVYVWQYSMEAEGALRVYL